MKYIIRGAHVVDPATNQNGPSDVAVEDGTILAVGQNLDPAGAHVVDASGLHLFPGFIDIHVHLREPGQEYKETIATGTAAAVAGGFTSVACMPNTSPVNDNAEITRFIVEQAAKEGLARVYPVGAISKGQKGIDLAAIGEMKEAGCVAITDDGRPVESAMLMRRAMEYAKCFDLPVISHCEDLTLAQVGHMNEGEVSTMLGLNGIPAEAEEIMVARDILLARLTGARVHLAHLSTTGSVALLNWAKASGICVTGETAPHYFTLTDEKVKSFDAAYKMNPPLRTATDLEAIIRGLADGTLDAIATDHAPHAPDEKEMEFEAAPNGVIGLEASFSLGLALVHAGRLTLPRLIELMSCKPASILNLPGGRLAPGAPADFALADLNQSWTVGAQGYRSKSKNCPFHGMTLKGRVIKTIAAGRLVHDGNAPAAESLMKAEYPR